MRLKSLKLRNYRKYREEQVDFPDGLVGILGPNGAGKSTLMEAIAWTLYGNTAARTAKEEIKTEGCSDTDICETVLEMELAGTDYQIVREMRGKDNASDAAVYSKKEMLARGARPTLDYVERMLGLNREAFFTSFFAKQRELNTLSDLKPAERKALIIRMLGIDRVDKAVQLAKEDARELEAKVEAVKAELKDLSKLEAEAGAEEKVVLAAGETLEKQLRKGRETEQAFKKAKKEMDRLEKLKEEHAALSQTYRLGKEALKHLEKEIAQGREELKALNSLARRVKPEPEPDLAKKRDELSAARERLGALNGELSRNQTMIKENRERLGKVARLDPGSTCPTCFRGLGNDDVDSVKRHLEEEGGKLKMAGARLKEKLGRGKQECLRLEKELAASEKERDQLIETRARLQQIDTLKKRLRAHEAAAKTKRAELAQTLDKGRSLGFAESEYNRAREGFEEARTLHESTKTEALEAKHRAEVARMKLDALKDEVKQQRKVRRRIKAMQKNRERLLLLDEVLASFRKSLIGRVRPALAQKAGQLLSEVTDGKYAALELDEDYEVYLHDQGKAFPLNRFSGGEADLVNLALRLAISEVMTEAARSDLGFIILDEIFGSQDPVRKANILKALGKLSNRFRQVFLITHIDEVKNAMEYVVSVSEDEDGSAHLLLS